VTAKEAQRYPLSSGARTLPELAALVSSGLSLKEIAQSWGMRPVAGAHDLQWDIHTAWDCAGRPGHERIPPWPKGNAPEGARAAYRAAVAEALGAWLDTFVDVAAPHGPQHCPTCTCGRTT
jgi:hypothetical protein